MKGVIAAVPTPIEENGTPLCDPFLVHCRWALNNGCDGLNILGSTGEANSFDVETRKEIMQWAAGAFDTSRLMVGTGTPSLAETITLTAHADKVGYGTVLVLPPYYYKPVTDDGLYRWYVGLHTALGTAKIGIYFYNFPQMTGIVIPPALIERLRGEFPERFTGIKDSSGDLPYCRKLAAGLPGFSVFPSAETSLSEAHVSGFAGCISATANQTAPLCAQIWQQRQAPDADLLAKVADQRTEIGRQPLIPAVKYLVGRRMGDSIWNNVLPPLVPLNDRQVTTLDGFNQNTSASIS